MALVTANFFSKSLYKNVSVHVILPLPNCDDYIAGQPAFGRGQMFQTLYLLHGAYGDFSEWLRFTGIERYAQEYRIAVVMASAENSFYLNLDDGRAFSDFFESELPNFAEAVFPLSPKREDRFIAGLSMGGYGAIRLAVKNPHRYAAAAGLSGAYDLGRICDDLSTNFERADRVYAYLSTVSSAEGDIATIASASLKSGQTMPSLFLSCGTEDYTLNMSRSLVSALTGLGIAPTYEEHPGDHNWVYWDTHIQRVLEWLPLKRGYVSDAD